MANDVKLLIDGIQVSVPAGTLLVEAAKRVPVEIPVYCYHEKLGPAGLCRVCLVEVEGIGKLQIACNTPATEGMVVHTQNKKVDDGRRAILEFLLLNHPLDCPVCDKGGECDLQDFVVAYGQGTSRVIEGKESKPKAVDLGPTIVLDEERCIVCQRCVRFDDLITRERSLVVVDRGAHDIIATATDEPYVSQFSGNVTELCPVGALTSKTYRFLSRKWDNHRATGSCAQCSVGCGINVDTRQNVITRTMSIPEDVNSDGWLCDRGRYTISFADDDRRVRTPLYRQGDSFVQISWDDAIGMWAKAIRGAASPARVAALGGGRLMNEENVLLSSLMRNLGSPHLDWRVGRGRQASAGASRGTIADIENAQAVVVVGIPPSQSSPIFDLHIRKAVFRRHAILISVGAFAAGSSVPEKRAAKMADVAALLPQDAKHIVVVWDGIDPATGRDIAAWSADLGKTGTTVRHFIAGSMPNGYGAEAMGMHPAFATGYEAVLQRGLDTAGILAAAVAGNIDTLSLHGANPVLTWNDGALVRKALAKIPFVVATDLFLTDTSELANLVLPVASAFERNGHFTNMFGEAREIRAALPVPEGLLTDAEVLVALADALGISLPLESDAHRTAVQALEPSRQSRFALGDERLAGADEVVNTSHGSLQVAVGTHIFTGGGTSAHDARVAVLRPKAVATLAPATANRLELQAGARVDLRCGDQHLRGLTVRIDPLFAEQTVGLIDGLPEAPANTIIGGSAVRLEAAAAVEPALA